MNESTYLILLSTVSPLIQKKTTMREAITPHERLTVTLRFLATGRIYEDLKFSTLGKIIPETCRAIYKVLKEYYKARVYNIKNIINNLLFMGNM